jgi:putative peptidoglycan lipid II flippase
VAQLGYARMLMLLPVSVVGQAVATAALPALSQLASEGRGNELDRTLLRLLQPSLMLASVLAAGVWALAEPAVALIFERGAFSAQDSQRVAAILSVFCFAIPAWVVQQVAGRGFYAREDMWRPMFLSTAVALPVIPVYLVLGREFGAEGIAAAGALAMSVSALVLLTALRLLHGGPALAPLGATLLRALCVALPTALASAWAVGLASTPFEACLAGGVAFAAVAMPGTWLAGDEATRDLLRGVARRLARKRGA